MLHTYLGLCVTKVFLLVLTYMVKPACLNTALRDCSCRREETVLLAVLQQSSTQIVWLTCLLPCASSYILACGPCCASYKHFGQQVNGDVALLSK